MDFSTLGERLPPRNRNIGTGVRFHGKSWLTDLLNSSIDFRKHGLDRSANTIPDIGMIEGWSFCAGFVRTEPHSVVPVATTLKQSFNSGHVCHTYAALRFPILPPRNGFLFLDRRKFAASFAGDAELEIADCTANSQVPWGLEAASAGPPQPHGRQRPSWYLLTADDHTIIPDLQRFMSKRAGSRIVEIKGPCFSAALMSVSNQRTVSASSSAKRLAAATRISPNIF
jgi:hypothetical protein